MSSTGNSKQSGQAGQNQKPGEGQPANESEKMDVEEVFFFVFTFSACIFHSPTKTTLVF